jgi:carboxyl-terminal processing protease
VIEEGTVSQNDEEKLDVREADLDRHLSNGEVQEPKPAKSKQDKSPADKASGDKSGAEKASPHDKSKLEPGEIVSKNDYQFNQALTLLKGLNLLQRK